jgi:hypothetical protein
MLPENRAIDGGKSALERRLAMGLENRKNDAPEHEIDLEEFEPDDLEDITVEE